MNVTRVEIPYKQIVSVQNFSLLLAALGYAVNTNFSIVIPMVLY